MNNGRKPSGLPRPDRRPRRADPRGNVAVTARFAYVRDMDTIFALSSGRLPAGVAVVRLSGPAAGPVVTALTGQRPPPPRRAALRILRDPEGGDVIDRALVLNFPAPASFTGEDVAELHVHGGPAVVNALLAVLARQPGCTAADAGAFTRRAFANGKLDLLQVEGLADLIQAETEAQRRQALAQHDGVLSTLYDGWRSQLLRIMALVEAEIDFAESEADVEMDIAQDVDGPLTALHAAIQAHLADARRGERLRSGLTIAVLGPPNAGKSSLINYLSQRDVAIVSPIAGTTRDVLEAHLDLGGYPVTLIDTAGLRETGDPIEQEGVARARRRAASADLILALQPMGEGRAGLPDDLAQRTVWRVATKADLSPDRAAPDADYRISVVDGTGIAVLVEALTRWAGTQLAPAGSPAMTRTRHRQQLQRCLESCQAARHEAADWVLKAEHLRSAAQALGQISGRIGVDDLLDVIFRDFCIGK